MAVVSTFTVTAASATDTRKLAAPIYKGAVPAVLAEGVQAATYYTTTFGGVKALDCQSTIESHDLVGKVLTPEEAKQAEISAGPWCFLTRDSIEEVKAFYDKSVGAMQPIQGENGVHGFEVFAERAWFKGEYRDGFGYRGVSVHALPPPPAKSKKPAPAMNKEDSWEGQEDFKFYGQFKHLGLFMNGVDWFGDPSKKHKPAEMEEMYKKYRHLYSAFFQRKGPKLEPVDEILGEHYGKLQGERQQAALMAPISARRELSMASVPAGSEDSSKEDAEFNRIMQRNPELARRYVALTQKVSGLTQQGKFDEADAVLDEIDALEQSNPELAALANQEQARSDNASIASQAQEDAIDTAANDQLDKALWGTAMEYIQAVDKEDYYTLIVIDNGLAGTEKDYSRDQALIAKETAGLIHQQDLHLWGIRYKQSRIDSAQPAASQSNGSPSLNTGTAQQPVPEEKKDDLGETAKKGLNALKKWF
jgi:hypothetical protein